MICEVHDCDGSAVATVIQVTHQARPGAEHAACHEHALDARERGSRVVEMHDDEIEWSGQDGGKADG